MRRIGTEHKGERPVRAKSFAAIPVAPGVIRRPIARGPVDCYAPGPVRTNPGFPSAYLGQMTASTDDSGDLWVFAYGSLMWRPGFEALERRKARLVGAHRALCVYSFVHRGTPEKPGLVLGLDRGGNCRGIAYRVAAARREQTIAYLREREQVTMVYLEAWRQVWLDDDPRESVRALCYIVDRGHEQYAGNLTIAEQLHYCRQGHGRSGANRDYVIATVEELETMGVRDRTLTVIANSL